MWPSQAPPSPISPGRWSSIRASNPGDPSSHRIACIGTELQASGLGRPSADQLPVSVAPANGELDNPVSYLNSTVIGLVTVCASALAVGAPRPMKQPYRA